jgi:hypothetical protein
VAELGELVRMLDALAAMPTRDPEKPDSQGVPEALKASDFAAAGLRLREARRLPAPAPRPP